MAMGAQPVDINFGSLGAFLGVNTNSTSTGKSAGLGHLLQPPGTQAKRSERNPNVAGPGAGLPSIRPDHDPFQDSANLNKKVAFKMLKQLGCPVQTVESDDDSGSVRSFIEVRQRVQPVLYQMLIEFGYQPFVTVDRAVAIRVDQPRYRARDEVFAALATRKPCQSSKEEPQVSARPKMSAEDEQRMVERLAERKAKTKLEADDVPLERETRKYKSVAEQRAAVDRLTRVRNEKEDDLVPSKISGNANTPPAPRSETWPRPGARLRGVSADAARRYAEDAAKSYPIRRSPCLSQVGAFMLQTPVATNDRNDCDKEASLAKASEVADNKEVQSPGLEEVAHHRKIEDEPAHPSRAWIDNVLGPLQWPSKSAAPRSKAEQKQYLERLAKPRPPPLPQSAEPTPSGVKRSTKEQKDACDRLSKPRDVPLANQTNLRPDEEGDAPLDAEGRNSRQSMFNEDSEDAEEPRVVVIPSMLSEFSEGLERIDEDVAPPSVSSKGGGRAGKQKQRASSVPPPSSAAKPYSIPVVPNSKISSGEKNRSGNKANFRSDNRSRNGNAARVISSEIPESSIQQLLNDPDLIAEVVQEEIDENGVEGGEAMLAHIDRLYNSLLLKCESPTSPVSEGRGNSTGVILSQSETVQAGVASQMQVTLDGYSPKATNGMEQSHVAQSAPKGFQESTRATLLRNHSPTEDCDDDDTSLLANIDHLYNEIVHVDIKAQNRELQGTTSSTPCAEVELPKVGPAQSVGCLADDEETKDLIGILEEVLWSALLLKRNSEVGADVQTNLLELVAPADFAQCYAACGQQCLPSSLLQRLSGELPAVHTGLLCTSPSLGQGRSKSIGSLTTCLRQARDHLLILASTSSSETFTASKVKLQPSDADTRAEDGAARKPKARKSSLSHWTADSLSALEAPPRRLTQRAPK